MLSRSWWFLASTGIYGVQHCSSMVYGVDVWNTYGTVYMDCKYMCGVHTVCTYAIFGFLFGSIVLLSWTGVASFLCSGLVGFSHYLHSALRHVCTYGSMYCTLYVHWYVHVVCSLGVHYHVLRPVLMYEICLRVMLSSMFYAASGLHGFASVP